MGRVARVLLAMLAALGLAPALRAEAAESGGPKVVPASWGAYAELVGRTLPAWLDEPSATRIRERLDTMPVDAAGDRRLGLRLWAAPDGMITRIEAADPLDAVIGKDLESLFSGRRLPATPPADLRWPIRLRLRLVPPPPIETAKRP